MTRKALARFMDVWPTNPWTGQPMAKGTLRGDFTYTCLDNGRHFRVAGHMGMDGDYIVP